MINSQALAQCPDDNDCDGIPDLIDIDGITDLQELTSCMDLTELTTTQTIFYNEDFGAGATKPGAAIHTLIDPLVYCYEDLTGTTCFNPNNPWVFPTDVHDNEYSILNNPYYGFPVAFRQQLDHTPNDTDGYQLVVNASDIAGEMFHKDNIAIPPSSFMQQTVVFSVWLSNIGSQQNQTTCANRTLQWQL